MLLLLGNFWIVCSAVRKTKQKKTSVVAYFCDCSFPSCLTDERSIGEELKWRELFSLRLINYHGNNYPTKKKKKSQSNKRQYPVEVWLRTFSWISHFAESESFFVGGSKRWLRLIKTQGEKKTITKQLISLHFVNSICIWFVNKYISTNQLKSINVSI